MEPNQLFNFTKVLFLTGSMVFTGYHLYSSSVIPPDAWTEPGKVTDQVRCRKHPAYTYAIYLPTGYTTGDTLPVFLAFDPGGSGVRPVNAYKDLAEKHRFILIGSNDSRNGQTLDQIEQMAFAMLTEVRDRYTKGGDNLYCMGFSGGSRVASIIAFYRGGIRGVVGCGAGLPALGVDPRYHTDYYGLVGNRDFNFLEMVQLEKRLDEMKIPNSLHIFDGKHGLPPAVEMERGIRWHLANAMAEGSRPPDAGFAEEVAREVLSDRQVTSGFDQKALDKEKKLQENYNEAIRIQPLSWWKKQTEKLNQPADTATYLLNQRLLAYSSMLAYTYSGLALKERNRSELERVIGIYETVDPENEYISYLKEQLNTLPR